jgi:hypothetical protein
MANDVVRADIIRRQDLQLIAETVAPLVQRPKVPPRLLFCKLQREEDRFSAVSGSVEQQLKAERGLAMPWAAGHQEQITLIQPSKD